MTITLTPKQVISAYGRLLNYSSNKRYGVTNNNFGNDVISSIARDFNTEINYKFNLDVFIIDKIEDLLQYESIVNKELSEYTYQNLINNETEDQVKALNHSYSLAQEDVFSINLFFEKDKVMEKELNKRGLTQSIIRSYFKNSEFVTGIKFDIGRPFYNIFFTTKTINFNGKESVALIRVGYIPERNIYTFDDIFIFKDKDFIKLKASPLKLLFRAIDYFGLELNSNGEMKKFIFEQYIPTFKNPIKIVNGKETPQTFAVKLDLFEHLKVKGAPFETKFSLVIEKGVAKINFVYAINRDAYLKYLKLSLK